MTAEIVFLESVGLWWPQADTANAERLADNFRRLSQQVGVAAGLCSERGLCLQAGGHVGIWPEALSRHFEHVVTCEPQPAAYAALAQNLQTVWSAAGRVTAHNIALGRETGRGMLCPRGDSGRTAVRHYEGKVVTIRAVDDWGLARCDAIYFDIEGSELKALHGARATIAKFRPVIQLEIWPKEREALFARMEMLGYRHHGNVHKDAIFVPGERA